MFPARVDTIVHTEKGSVHCICPHTGEQRDLAFQVFEAARKALKYRCPAAAYGLDCQGRDRCHQAGDVAPGDDGRIVRISLDDHDRRIFVPTLHGSPSWQRGYNRRSALERINNRIDKWLLRIILNWAPRRPDLDRAHKETPARQTRLTPTSPRSVREKRHSATVSRVTPVRLDH